MKRKWDIENEAIQKKCVDEIIARIEEIESSTVGIIAAQDIIDIVTENLGPELYNMGIRDAKKIMQAKMQDVEFDIDMLEQKSSV
jgi:uncharacterized protein (DUF2164 family)